MATVDEVLNIERSFLGEGGQRFWAWYPAAPGTAWCDIFQSYCLTAAGIDTHYAWVSAHFDHLRKDYDSIGDGWRGRCTTNVRWAQPGDLLAFEWNSTPGGYDHIAMVESVDANGVTAINGNVNGSRVQRLWHSFATGGIAEIARPPYSSAPTPGPVEAKDSRMFHMKNVDGRDEYIALTAGGQVVSCWAAKPGGKIGPWAELRGGIAGSNLVAEVAPDGRLCVTLAAMGELWGSWQSSPASGPWVDWFRVNDLRALVA